MKEKEYLEKYVDNDKLEEAYKQLNEGIPVQYIVGNVDFMGNIINVNKNVLIPRFETELLVDKTVAYIKKNFNGCIDILDLATGSGCIAISLKKLLNARVDASDISSLALDVARENAKINGVDIKYIESDMLCNIKKRYDVIISNPPYLDINDDVMDIVKNNEPHIALFAKDKGLFYYKIILENISYNLKDKFIIALEIGESQADSIKLIASKYLKNINIRVEVDYNNRDRFIFITSKDIKLD